MKAAIFSAALLWAAPALASRLYAASYAGTVSTLSLEPASNGTGHLSVVSQSSDCGPSPSWLMLDGPRDILYCLDEGVDAPNGSITSFQTNADGSLTTIKHIQTISGPVMSVLYSASGVPGREFMAVAHYGGSALTTYSVDPIHGLFDPIQSFVFHMDGPGPNPSRQDAPHPHGAYVDPTGRFVLIPDLGADLIRIFAINQRTGYLEPVSPFVTEPGLGPRHIAFWMPAGPSPPWEVDEGEVYLYLVSELTNRLLGYKVTYSSEGLSFNKLYDESTFGQQKPGPEGSKAAEIAISPQNNHLIVSNRLDSTFGPGKDSFAIFSCADSHGTSFAKPAFLGLQPAFSSNPRQFEISHSFHQPEPFVAVAMEDGREITVTEWDHRKEAPGKLYARKSFEGKMTAVIWDQ